MTSHGEFWHHLLPPIRQETGRLLSALGNGAYDRKQAQAVSGKVEGMALAATLGFEEGCTILANDGANAFNSIYYHRFLPAVAEIVPSMAPYVANLYGREPSKALFALDEGVLEGFESGR